MATQVSAKNLVEVFVNDQYQITNADFAKRQGYQVEILNLDDNVRLQKMLSAGLKPGMDVERMRQIAGSRIKSLEPDSVKRAWKPVVQAGYYELFKFPAIVFNNGEAVVYGITDISVAIHKYETWIKQ